MHLHHPAIAVLLAAVIAGGAHAASPTPAAMGALVNARIHTLDDSRPAADAIAWDATGRIIAVGRRDEVLAQAPGATVHDANGATVVPGLVDAHAHLMGLGLALMRADLVGTRSKAEVVARLQAFAATLPPEAWLLGRGWDQNDWPEQTFPTAADLDAAFPDRPVWLERIDGHAGWANSAAMRRAARDLNGDLATGRRADRAHGHAADRRIRRRSHRPRAAGRAAARRCLSRRGPATRPRRNR